MRKLWASVVDSTGEEVTTTRIGFTGDDLPEDHLLCDFDGAFHVTAKVTPGCEAGINCDPDDGWAAEPTEIEITGATLSMRNRFEISHELRSDVEAAFLALIDSDDKLRDRVREEISEAYSESRLCRSED